MVKMGFVISIMACFHAGVALAQDTPPEVPQKENTAPILKNGQPIRWRWKNGRQAILIETFSDVKDFAVGLTMTKNTCNEAPAPRCYLKSRIRQRVVAKVWEKYPDKPKLIGTLLEQDLSSEKRYREDESDTNKFHIFSYLITSLGQMRWKSLGLNTYDFPEVEDNLVCDNFKWLPKSENGEVLIDSWMTQFEYFSSELQLGNGDAGNTNQYVTAAHQVELEKKSANELRVSNARVIGTTFDFAGVNLSLGYTTVMNFDRERVGVKPQASQGHVEWSDPQCRVEMTINFSELFTKITALTGKEFPRPNTKNSRPVLFNLKDPLVYANPNGFMLEQVYQ